MRLTRVNVRDADYAPRHHHSRSFRSYPLPELSVTLEGHCNAIMLYELINMRRSYEMGAQKLLELLADALGYDLVRKKR
jgi:hypothetical protein